MSIESQIFLQVVLTAVAAVGASFFTARFALRRFYSEKWWEKKAEAYSAILEALHYMKRHYDENWDAKIEGRELPEDRRNDLQEKSREAYDELKKRIDIGQFVLSDEAVAELSAFQKEYNKAAGEESWTERYDASFGATNDALGRMRTIAKADLKGR